MANRTDIMAGEAFVALELDDSEYQVAMKAAMAQLKRFERESSGFSRAMKTIDRGLSLVATKLRVFGRAVQSVVGSVSRFSRLIFDTLAPSLFFLGASAASMGASILAAVVPAAKAFASLEDVVSRFRIVFGDQARATEAWARSFARSIGFADSTILDVIGRFQALLTTQGAPAGMAATASRGLAELVPNLASFFEMRPDDVITRLFSGLVGEMEAVRRLGVDLSAQSVNRQLESVGINPQEATQAQKALARYNIIVEQTKVAQEDLRKTSDSLANTVTRLNEAWKRTKEVVGAALAPALTSLAGLAQRVLAQIEPFLQTGQFQRIATSVVAIGAGLSALGAASVTIAPLVTAFGSLASFATALAGVVTGGLVAGMVAMATAARAVASALAPLGRLVPVLVKLGLTDLGELALRGSRAAGRVAGPGIRAVREAQGRLTSSQIAERGLFGVRPGRAGLPTLNRLPIERLSGPRATRPVQPTQIVSGPYGLGARVRATEIVPGPSGGTFRRNIPPQAEFFDPASANKAAKAELSLAQARRKANMTAGAAEAVLDVTRSAFDGTSRSVNAAGRATGRVTTQLGKFRTVQTFVSGSFPKLLEGVKNFGTSIARIGKAIGPSIVGFEIAFRGISLALRPVTASISSAFGGVFDAGKQLIGVLGGVGSALLATARTLSLGFSAIIESLIGGDPDRAARIAVAGFDLLKVTAKVALTQVGNAFSDLFSAVSSGLKQLINSAIYFASIISNPVQFLKSIREQAERSGPEIDARLTDFLEKQFEPIGQGANARRAEATVSNGKFTVVTPTGDVIRGGVDDPFGLSTLLGLEPSFAYGGGKEGDALAKKFVEELSRQQRDVGGRVAREQANKFAADIGISSDIGKSLTDIFMDAKNQFESNAELQAANARFQQAINSPLQRQPGPNIPGAQPEQVDLSELVDAINESAASAKSIAETASITDSSARTRFGSGKAVLDVAKEQLAVLKRLEKKEGAKLQGVGL